MTRKGSLMKFENEAIFVELWSVDRLIAYPRNPRTHSARQIAQIGASIAEFATMLEQVVKSRTLKLVP